MSGSDVVRAWTGARFEATTDPIGETLAADSWLVVDGAVLALDRHRRRFADAVTEAGGEARAALAAADAAATRAARRLVAAPRPHPRQASGCASARPPSSAAPSRS